MVKEPELWVSDNGAAANAVADKTNPKNIPVMVGIVAVVKRFRFNIILISWLTFSSIVANIRISMIGILSDNHKP